MPGRFRASLRERRQQAGLQQQELAARVGVSRQTISAIETGETVPSTEIALDLARALGCKVEQLFAVAEAEAPIDAELVGGSASGAKITGKRPPVRVAVGRIGERWVAHPLSACSPRPAASAADGLAAGTSGGARVRPLLDGAALRRTLFVAGCDPAIGLLGAHLAELTTGPRVRWLPLGSGASLAAQAAGRVHLAGLHLSAGGDDDGNPAEVRRALAGRATVLVNLASWEQGLVVAAGNPRGLRKIADLRGRGVRVVGREAGAGAQRLLERGLAAAGIKSLAFAATARGHLEVAQAVAFDQADAGVATREAAEAFGLTFVPLEEARFDLVVPEDLQETPLVRALLDTLASARFKRELRALAGYETRRTGDVVARIAA